MIFSQGAEDVLDSKEMWVDLNLHL